MDELPFDRVFVIALPDRLDGVLAALGKAAIRPEVFPAILKGDLDTRALVEAGYAPDHPVKHLPPQLQRCYFGLSAVCLPRQTPCFCRAAATSGGI